MKLADIEVQDTLNYFINVRNNATDVLNGKAEQGIGESYISYNRRKRMADIAIRAIKNAMRKKVVPLKTLSFIGLCPECKLELCIDDEDLHFCPRCGQALKVGDE